jgi:hypothetical protein
LRRGRIKGVDIAASSRKHRRPGAQAAIVGHHPEAADDTDLHIGDRLGHRLVHQLPDRLGPSQVATRGAGLTDR